MAKKCVMDLAFFDLPKIRELPLDEAFLMATLVFNVYASRSGIYTLSCGNFAKKKGINKFLVQTEFDEIESIVKAMNLDEEEQIHERVSLLEDRAGRKIKKMLRSLIAKELVKFDPETTTIYILSYHNYIPLTGSNAKAIIVACELMAAYNANPHPKSWNSYWTEYKTELIDFFSKAEQKAASSAKDRTLLHSPEYLKLKKILFDLA